MPKIVDHQSRRVALLERCFDLFAHRGFAAVTMREIAKEVGVSTGTLYHYFKTKEDILHQMFLHMSRRDVDAAKREIPEDSTPEQRLHILFRFIARNETSFQHLIFMAIDYLRLHTRETAEACQETLTAACQFYRQAIGEQLGLTGSELEKIFFSYVVGILVQRILDPSVTYDTHLAFLEKIAPHATA